MLAASIMMFRKSSAAKVVVEANGGGSTAASNSNKPQNEQAPKKLNYLLISTQALAVGLLSGVIGVGGGFLIVPALVLLARISIKDAIGTSLLIIALNSGTGFVSYLSLVEIPWLFLFKFTAFSGVGILIGTRLVPHVKQEHLKKAFSVFLVLMGLFILGKNLF